jgi:hypothetical protein
VVLFIDQSQADDWDALDVIERWHLLFSGTLYWQRCTKGVLLTAAEQASLNGSIALWRGRLMDISWFVRIINEGITRMANREDDCTGRFWEGHFSSQALLDEKVLATCYAYVDLKPIRAGIVDSLTDSDHTSINRLCEQVEKAEQPNDPLQQADGLHSSLVTLDAICQTAYRLNSPIT